MMWFLFLSILYFVVPSYSIHHAIHLANDLAIHLAKSSIAPGRNQAINKAMHRLVYRTQDLNYSITLGVS